MVDGKGEGMTSVSFRSSRHGPGLEQYARCPQETEESFHFVSWAVPAYGTTGDLEEIDVKPNSACGKGL